MIRKLFLSLVLSVATLLVFAGCTPKTHKVTFKQNNGQNDVIKEVKHGQKVEKPNNPVNEGFVFQFWAENGKEFDFNTKIEKDHILTATWTEQTTGLKVVLPEGIKVTTPNVDLTNLNKGTKLDFEITVPNYHFVKSLLANTSDIMGKLKEGKKFSFTVNKNITFKVTFDVVPEVKGELNTQLGKVTDIVVKKLETDPKLTLEQVKAKVAEKLDLTLVDLEVVQKEEKFVVTLTSKKVNTLKAEKEITVTYEKLDVHVVSANQNFTVLTPNVELTAVKHGTELEFQVVVPTGKVVDTLKANNKDIKSTLTTDNKFKYTVNEDVTFEVTFKLYEQAINEQVQKELDKIENLIFDLVDDQQEKTEAELKTLLETKVNVELVTLELVKNTTDYTVTLKSKVLETVTKTKNITVTYNKFYSVTVPAEITVEGGQDLTKVPANTKLVFVVTLATGQIVKTLKANEDDIFSTLVGGNKFEYTVTKKVTFTITFDYNESIIEQEVETELNKIQDNQNFEVIEAETLTVEELKVEITKLVDNKLVEVEVIKVDDNYTVKLTSKKINTVVKSKSITIAYSVFYSVTTPEEITVQEGVNLGKVQKGTEVEFKVTVPQGKTISILTVNAENVIEKLDSEFKFKATINEKTIIELTFVEVAFEHVVRDNEVTLTGIKGDAGLLIIPAEIEGLPVTKLGREFLQNNKKVKKVIFPASLKEIGISAFEDSVVTEVVLKEGLTTISQYAFYRSSLKAITIPASVTEIGFNAFSKSKKLEDITFKNNNLELHIRMFFDTKFLDKNKNEDGLYIINNVLLGAEIKNNRNLVVPANITKIARNAFDRNTYDADLTTVDFTQATQLVEIGDSAFLKQENLRNLEFPTSLRVIGSAAFMQTKNLRTVKFNTGLTEIKSSAFYGAEELTNVELPETITILNNNVFGKAKKLVTITANGVKEIKDGALRTTAFTLNQLNNKKIAVLNGILYQSDVFSTIDVVVPSNVKVIAEYAFSLTKFTSITFPNTVEKIEKYAVHQTLTQVIKLGGFIKEVKEKALYFTRKSGVTLVITDVDQRPATWAENFYHSIIGDKLNILWAPEVTINYDLQEGDPNGETFDSYVINKNGKATRPQVNPTKENFVFGGWLVKGQQFVFETTPVVETITLVANWIAKSEDFNFEFNEEYGFTLVKSLKADATSVAVPTTFGNITVNRIADNAFVGSIALTSVVIPDSIKSIGEKVFHNVATLANIEIPATLKLFGAEAFIGTAWLTQKRNEATDKVVIVNEVLIDAIAATGELTVNGVTKVNGKAFKGSQVTKVTLNDGLVEIAREGFAEAAELTEVVVPATIEIIGQNAFANTKAGFVLNAETILYELDGFETGYNNDGRGGEITVKFNPTAEFISITVSQPGAIVPQNPKLKLNKIFKTTEEQVVLVVKTPKHHFIKTLNVNGENYLDQLTDEGLFELTPDKDYNIVVEFEVDEKIKQAIEVEKDKLGTELGVSEVDNFDLSASVPRILNNLVNTEVAEVQYVSNDENKVTFKVVSKLVPTYSVQVELNYHVYFDLNKDLLVHAKSGQANSQETPYQLIDDSLSTKWCDVGTGQHYVILKFDNPKLVSKFTLVHAGEQENAGFITREYDIYVSKDGEDYVKVVEVRNNKTNRLSHNIKTTEVKFIKFQVFAGEQGSEGNSTARVYDFRVYGKDTKVPITVQLNGGNYNGKTDDVTMYPDKFHNIRVHRFSVFKRDFYVFDKVVDASTNEEINLNTTKFEAPRTIKIVWKVDPAVGNQMQTEINKLYDPFVVETTNTTPTEEEIKQELAKKMNVENCNLVLVNKGGNKYEVTLELKINTEIKITRTITVLPRTAGETKQLTLRLNGGKLGETATDIVITVLKGEKATRPQGLPTKENYDFLGWILNGKLYDFDSVVVDDLTIEGTYSPSKANTKAFNEEVDMVALDQGLNDISTLNLETVKQEIGKKLNSEVVTFDVVLVEGTTYKVTITSKKCPELTKILQVKFEKNITVEVPEGIKVNGQTGTITLIKGVTYRLEVQDSFSYEIKKILLKDVDITANLFNLSYYFTAEEEMTIVFEKALNPIQFAIDADDLEEIYYEIPNVLKFFKKNSKITKEDVEKHFKQSKYSKVNVEVTLLEENQFSVKLISKNSPEIFRTKVIYTLNVVVGEGVSVHDSTSPSIDENNFGKNNLLDYSEAGELNLETIWTTKTKKPEIVLELQEPKKIDGLHISFAKLLAEDGQASFTYYPNGFDIYAGNDLDSMKLAYSTVNSRDKDVTLSFNDKYLKESPNPIKFVKIKITKYAEYFFDLIRVEGIELLEQFTYKGAVLTIDLNGGTYQDKEVIYQKYEPNAQLSQLSAITPTKPNFTFAGFQTEDGQSVTEITQITKDMTIYAKWERETTATQTKYTITFNLNGGNVDGVTTPVVIEVYENEKIVLSSLPKVQKDNFVFEKFVTTEGVPFDFTQPITENVELTARYFGELDYKDFITSKQLRQLQNVLDSDKNTLELVEKELGYDIDEKEFRLDVIQVRDEERFVEYKATVTLIADENVKTSKLIRVYKVINITKYAKISLDDNTYRLLTDLTALTDMDSEGSQNLETEFKFAQIEESEDKVNKIYFSFNKVLLTKVKIYLQNPSGDKHDGLNNSSFYLHKVDGNGYNSIHVIPQGKVTNDLIEFNLPSNSLGSKITLLIRDQGGKLVRIHGIELFGIAY